MKGTYIDLRNNQAVQLDLKKSCGLREQSVNVIVRFQNLTRTFTPYAGTTYTVSSGNCPSFLCAISSSLLMLV